MHNITIKDSSHLHLCIKANLNVYLTPRLYRDENGTHNPITPDLSGLYTCHAVIWSQAMNRLQIHDVMQFSVFTTDLDKKIS